MVNGGQAGKCSLRKRVFRGQSVVYSAEVPWQQRSPTGMARPRTISTPPLSALPRVHVEPINQVVSLGPYRLNGVGCLILG